MVFLSLCLWSIACMLALGAGVDSLPVSCYSVDTYGQDLIYLPPWVPSNDNRMPLCLRNRELDTGFRPFRLERSTPGATGEDFLFACARSLFEMEHYPAAALALVYLLDSYPMTAHRDEITHMLFTIANDWLDEFREKLNRKSEPSIDRLWKCFLVHDRRKSLLFSEFWSLCLLEYIAKANRHGRYTHQALFLSGCVAFHRSDYVRADSAFSTLIQTFPESPFLPLAIKWAIIAKLNSRGFPCRNREKLAETFELIEWADRNFPSLVAEDKEFFERQRVAVRIFQSELDFELAESYRKKGKLRAAASLYKHIRQSCPGTRCAELARERLARILQEGAGMQDGKE